MYLFAWREGIDGVSLTWSDSVSSCEESRTSRYRVVTGLELASKEAGFSDGLPESISTMSSNDDNVVMSLQQM